jgi:hypothetical protein
VARQVLEPIGCDDDDPDANRAPYALGQGTEDQDVDPVQAQLDAYNARNIERFLACYAPDVVVEDGAGNVELRGIDALRQHYESYFAETDNLHCRVVNRIRIGEYVIDEERIRSGGRSEARVVAIYRVSDKRIAHVRFLYDQPKRWTFWKRT